MQRLFVLSALALCIACPGGGGGGGEECGVDDGVQVRFDASVRSGETQAQQWVSFPFPSDHRRYPDGRPDFSDFPNPDEADLVENYIDVAEGDLDGFGTSSPVHLSFDGPLDLATLPADPAAFLSVDAPLQLVDVTEGSPEYGRRRPLRWSWNELDGKFLAPDSLAVGPEWGFPLRQSTTYALLVTRELEGEDGEPLGRPALLGWLLGEDTCLSTSPTEDEQRLRDVFEPLRQWMADDGFDATRLAAATVFTTQNVTWKLEALHAHVASLPAPALEDAWQPIGQNDALYLNRRFQWSSTRSARFYVMEGRFRSPNYQEGEVPYASTGGALRFVDGVPEPVRYEDLRFVLTIPDVPPPDGGSCYPIVQYAHGTGGSAYGFASDTAGRLAGRGLAAISIDQPMHGPRDMGRVFDVGLMTFNFPNGDSTRALFLQSAVDTFSLTRFVRESLRVPLNRSPSGREICFDPDRVSFFGHSHGGLSGSMALPFEDDITSWMLSGAGGGLAITLMNRRDYTDIKELLTLLFGIQAPEELSETHPAITLMQTLGEVTDPHNYAPHWMNRLDGGAPPDVLVTSGTLDEPTHHRTATAMSVAAEIPVIAPVEVPVPSYDWLGLAPATSPVAANIGDAAAGMIQWQGEDHFVVFSNREAIHASNRFLESAAYWNATVIERDPSADVR